MSFGWQGQWLTLKGSGLCEGLIPQLSKAENLQHFPPSLGIVSLRAHLFCSLPAFQSLLFPSKRKKAALLGEARLGRENGGSAMSRRDGVSLSKSFSVSYF